VSSNHSHNIKQNKFKSTLHNSCAKRNFDLFSVNSQNVEFLNLRHEGQAGVICFLFYVFLWRCFKPQTWKEELPIRGVKQKWTKNKNACCPWHPGCQLCRCGPYYHRTTEMLQCPIYYTILYLYLCRFSWGQVDLYTYIMKTTWLSGNDLHRSGQAFCISRIGVVGG